MILKKPYAFLIKHFRLINLIIATLSGFIIYKSFLIVTFFRDYVNNRYTGTFYTGFYQEYVSPLVLLIIFLIILGIAVIYLLLAYKKKKVKSYTFSFYFYILLFIYYFIIRSIMVGMQEELLSAEIARACRDISIIMFVLQIPYLILFVARFFGFNIGKYNFKEDLKELEISDQDSEEVEITFNQDSTKLKRTIRRFRREFLYYLKENKIIFIIVSFVILAIGGYFTYRKLPNIIDNEYKQGDIFYMNDLTYQVQDSIITNLNYNGDVISNDKYYIVIKLYIENNSDYNVAKIDYKNFRLELGNNKFAYPDLGKGDYFIDYAKDSFLTELGTDTKNTYSLIFEIDKENINNRYKLKISNGTIVSDNNIVGKYNYVNISPIVIDNIVEEGIYNENDEISFINSNLSNTTLTVSNITITDKYFYDYQKCSNENCQNYKDMITINYKNNNNTLIVMDYKYDLDKTIPFYNNKVNFNKFINSFMKIKYVIGEEEFYSNVTNKTPDNLKNKFVLEIPKKSLNSDNVYLAIIIRNKEYLINIKK